MCYKNRTSSFATNRTIVTDIAAGEAVSQSGSGLRYYDSFRYSLDSKISPGRVDLRLCRDAVRLGSSLAGRWRSLNPLEPDC